MIVRWYRCTKKNVIFYFLKYAKITHSEINSRQCDTTLYIMPILTSNECSTGYITFFIVLWWGKFYFVQLCVFFVRIMLSVLDCGSITFHFWHNQISQGYPTCIIIRLSCVRIATQYNIYIHVYIYIYMNIQSSVVIARSNKTWFCIWYNNDWSKICIRVYIHKRHTSYLALTGELLGVLCEDLGEIWPRYNGTALYLKIIRIH